MSAAAKTEEKTIVIERTYKASAADVWDLWTTKDGIESWWGPDGFAVKVTKLELRAGGELLYTMIAVGKEQIAFMKQAGMATETKSRITYTEVSTLKRLAYMHLVDFVPDVKPYDVGTLVELHVKGAEVRLVLTLDKMHDAVWNQRMSAGWESELGKLDRALAARKGSK